MARRKTKFSQGEYYHIYNRGCNRQNIFRSEENYLFLSAKLAEVTERFSISVIVYSLMPNHYHFLLRQDGDESAGYAVQLLFNSYTKAFNAMYTRTGTLFEGPFKSIHVDKREYLVHLCRYIHRNPLESGLVVRLEDWRHSNFPEWVGQRNGTLVDKDFVKEHFADPDEYREFVMNYTPSKQLATATKKYLFD